MYDERICWVMLLSNTIVTAAYATRASGAVIGETMLAWWQQHRVSGGRGGGAAWGGERHGMTITINVNLEMLECCSYLLGMLTSVKLWRLVQ